MCTVWSSAETGFSTKGLWKTWPPTSIVSSVSISVSLEEAGGRVGGRKEEGKREERGGGREEGGKARKRRRNGEEEGRKRDGKLLAVLLNKTQMETLFSPFLPSSLSLTSLLAVSGAA